MKPITPPDRLVRILTYLTAAIFVLVPFHALFTTWLGQNFGAIDLFRIWKELLLILLVISCVWLFYADKQKLKQLSRNTICQLIGMYFFINVALGSIAYARDGVTAKALAYGLIVNLRFLAFFLVCAVLVGYYDWLRTHWQRLVLWPAYGVIVFALLQLLVLPKDFLTHFGYGPGTIPALHTVDQKLQFMRLQSTLRGPNPLGAYLIIILTAFAGFFLSRIQQLKQFVWLVLGGAVLFFTYSRSAWLGLVLSIAVFVWVSVRRIRRRQLFLLAILFVVLSAGFTFVFRENDFVQNAFFHTDERSASATSSNEVRSSALSNAAKDVVRHPFGQGPGTAGPASFRNNRPKLAENYYLQIGQELGVLGLGVFLAINVLVARSLYVVRKDILARILLASFAGLTLVNMFSHAWADDTLAYLWWGLAGIMLSTVILKTKAKA